jgi:hypothetical protein
LSLDDAEVFDFAQWVLKTWLLTAHPARRISDPGWNEALEPWDLSAVPDDLYGWTVTGKNPPDGLSVWIARVDPDVVSADSRIPLPTVVADGRTMKFQSFANGMHFLDAGFIDLHLVYHPGWQVEHPLESEGRAARLWPHSGDSLDIAALPLLTEGQVSWYVGPNVHFEPGAYETVERPRLSIETPLEFFPFPPGVFMVRR